jgi:hypothetical protein
VRHLRDGNLAASAFLAAAALLVACASHDSNSTTADAGHSPTTDEHLETDGHVAADGLSPPVSHDSGPLSPCPGGDPPPGVDIGVAACVSEGPLNVASGTQQDQAHDTTSFPAPADARLVALAPTWFRIHAGADDTPSVLPETSVGQWDFTQMDLLVGKAFESGGTPMMNIRYPPPFMWTCNNPFNGNQGTVVDTSYATFAAFVARIVSYYNKGSMTDENGMVVKNPHGTAQAIHYWELWNEPDISDETPCSPSGVDNPALSPAEYNTMWDAVSSASLAVDSTLKLVGPAVSQPITGQTPEYVPNLLTASHLPNVVSVHGYGGDDSTSDYDMLRAPVDTEVGLEWIVTSVGQIETIMAQAGHASTPLWLDETNVNYDLGQGTGQREWTGFGAAWIGAELIGLANLKTPQPVVYLPFEFVSPQDDQSLVDPNSGAPLLSYWRDVVLPQHLVTGRSLAKATNTSSALGLATRDDSSGVVDVLVVNDVATNNSTVGGPGTKMTVTVGVGGMPGVRSVTLWIVDDSVVQGGPNGNLTSGPTAQSLPVGLTATVSFAGYGAAVVEFAP